MYERARAGVRPRRATTPPCASCVLTGAGERAFCVGADLERVDPGARRRALRHLASGTGAHLKGTGVLQAGRRRGQRAVPGRRLRDHARRPTSGSRPSTPSFGFPEPTHRASCPPAGRSCDCPARSPTPRRWSCCSPASASTPEHLLRVGVLNQVVAPRAPARRRPRTARAPGLAERPRRSQTIKAACSSSPTCRPEEAFAARGAARPARLHQRRRARGAAAFAARRPRFPSRALSEDPTHDRQQPHPRLLRTHASSSGFDKVVERRATRAEAIARRADRLTRA